MMQAFTKIEPGKCVVVNMHSPREKIWGILIELENHGIQICGIDINTFEDWLNSILKDEYNIGLSYSFLPMWRVERVSLDETTGTILSLEQQFANRLGISILEYISM